MPQRPAQRPAVRSAANARRKPKTRWNPKFLAACAGILLVLILIPILIAVILHHGDAFDSPQIHLLYSGNTGRTSVVLNGKIYERTLSGRVEKESSSRDGMTKAALFESGEMVYITEDTMSSVATDVQSFVLSSDGGRLAYVMKNTPETTDTTESTTKESTTTRSTQKNTNEEPQESTTEYVPAGAQSYLVYDDTALFVYKGADNTSPLIANHVSADSVCLSPNGECVAYTVPAEDGESFEGFCFRDGVSTSIGRNALPIAVSDDGLRLLYVKYELMDDLWVQKLFFRNGDNEYKLDEYADGNKLNVFLNLDYSEIVFTTTGQSGIYYFCGPDGEKKKISNGFSPLYSFGNRSVLSGKAVLTPYESFAKTVFCDAAGTAHALDDKFMCSDLGATGIAFRITPDGKTIYYLDKDEYLYSCTVRKADKKEVASHVLTFDLSADGKIVYYVNSDNELHCVKGSKDTVRAEDVYTSNIVELAVTESGYLYFLQDYSYGSGTLCYLKGDGSAQVLNEINTVYRIAPDVKDNIYYLSDYNQISKTYDVYYGSGKKYTKLFDKMG